MHWLKSEEGCHRVTRPRWTRKEPCTGCVVVLDRSLFHYRESFINSQNGEEGGIVIIFAFLIFPLYLSISAPPPHLLQSDFNHHFRQNTLSRCVSGGKTALRSPSITFYLQQWCIAGALLWRLKRICWISIECVWWMTVLAHNKGTSNGPTCEEVRTFTKEKQLHTQTFTHSHTLMNTQMTAQTLRQL